MTTLTQHRSPKPGASTSTAAPSSTTTTTTTFTPEMRDRQARGKNPYTMELDAQPCSPYDWNSPHHHARPKEDYHDRERKDLAMAVLDSPERLLMYAQANDDSMAGQRLAFLRALHCQPLKESERRRDEDRRRR